MATSVIDRIHNVAFQLSCLGHRLLLETVFLSIFLAVFVVHRLHWALGRMFYLVRGHDSALIHHSPPFSAIPNPNISLKSDLCGDSGCRLGDMYIYHGPGVPGKIPFFSWSPPENFAPVEYAMICEDADWPVPATTRIHCFLYNIPPNTRELGPLDLLPHGARPLRTRQDWGYMRAWLQRPYRPLNPPLGHGEHRYFFTIIALNKPVEFADPRKITRQSIIQAIQGKVVGWGQWMGRGYRP